MAITYVGAGSIVYSTGNPVTTAAANAVGDLLILLIGTKPDSTPATTPSGWTSLGNASGGTGSTGIDTGPMRVGVFYKVATSTNETAGTVTVTGNNVSTAQIFAFRAGAGNVLDIVGTGAADTTTGTPMSATMPLNPGLTVGDMLLAVGVVPTDVATFSAQSVAATGMTTVSLTEINEWTTTSGQDMGGWIARGAVVTGTASAAPTVSATVGGTSTNAAGPIYLVRMRETAAAPIAKAGSDSGTISATESASVVAETPGYFTAQGIEFQAGTPFTSSASVTSGTASLVPGTDVGDYSIIVATLNATSGVISTPAGWTNLQASQGSTASTSHATAVFYRKYQAGDGDVTVTSTSGRLSFNVVRVRSAHQTNFIDSVGVGYSSPSGATMSTIAPTITTSNPGVLVTWHSGRSATNGIVLDWTEAGDMTDLTEFGSNAGAQTNATGIMSVKNHPSAGATGDKTATTDLNATGSSGVSFVVLPLPPIPVSDSGTISATESAVVAPLASPPAYSLIEKTGGTVQTSGTWTSASFTPAANSLISVFVSVTGSASDTATRTNSMLSTTITGMGTWNIAQASNTGVSAQTATYVLYSLAGSSPSAGTISINLGGAPADMEVSVIQHTGVNTTTPVGSVTFAEYPLDTQWAITLSPAPAENDRAIAFITSRNSNMDPTPLGTNVDYEFTTIGTSPNATQYLMQNYAQPPDSLIGADAINSVHNSGVAMVIKAAEAGGGGGPQAVAANDTGTISATDSATVIVSATLAASDTGTVSATEDATLVKSFTLSDSGTLSATDASSNASTLSRTDTGTLSATDTSGNASTLAASDTGTISATDASSMFVSNSLSASDSGTVSATETSTLVKSIALSDSGTISATDTSVNASSLSRSDTGTFSAIDVSANGSTLVGSDTGTISATDTAAIVVTMVPTDAGTFSVTESVTLSVSRTITDTGTISATDSSTMVKNAALSDTGTISATDAAVIVSILARTDTGTISATDNLSLFESAGKSASDSGTISATESTSIVVTVVPTESGTFSATEAATLAKSIPLSDTGTLSSSDSAVVLPAFFVADSGTLSATDTSSVYIAAAINATDSGSLSATEGRSISGTAAITDSGSISATDTATVFKAISLADSGTVSATETAVPFNDRPAADSGVISATDAASVTVTGTISKVGSDSGTLSATEGRTIVVTLARTDTGTLSATEARPVASTSTRTDTGTISATETVAIIKTSTRSDAGTISATDTATIFMQAGTQVKVWNGSAWVSGTIRVWNGTQWIYPTLHRWDGNSWV